MIHILCYDCCIYALIEMFVTLMLIFEISRASLKQFPGSMLPCWRTFSCLACSYDCREAPLSEMNNPSAKMNMPVR